MRKCDVCGADAGFEESPEGQQCSCCGDAWVCDACTTWVGELPRCPKCAEVSYCDECDDPVPTKTYKENCGLCEQCRDRERERSCL